LHNRYHKSVLLESAIEALAIDAVGIYCDATLGDGGYSWRILERLSERGQVIGIDRDREALARARQRLLPFGERFQSLQGNFGEIKYLLHQIGIFQVNGIVCDLGVSTLQISRPERGFMFSAAGPLDMRMSPEEGVTAADVINTLSESELAQIILQYGEERLAKRIAAAIVRERSRAPLSTTSQLAEVVRRVVGERFVIKTLARVFQSFRIYVNNELDNLEKFLQQACELLVIGGRLVVVEYHSLESRLVKDFIRRQTHPCTCPTDLPLCVCGKKASVRIIHHLVKPSEAEIAQNPSARSARLRAVEKIGEDR
jgi:16S rRNA (cytosine1402-N4)-methyltransferase